MYRVIKTMEISGSHQLKLSYQSKCENFHGHNWRITICVRAYSLNDDGMVIDFTHLKKLIKDKLDHTHLNDVVPFNPTAEKLAYWIAQQVDEIRQGAICERVTVQESEGNIAEWSFD